MKPSGDCYKAAFEHAGNLACTSGKRHHIDIVHGSVIPRNGPWAHRRICHAWVEADGSVHEFSNGNEKVVAESDFQQAFSPLVHAVYDFEQANMLVVKTEHYGPWDEQSLKMGEEESGGY
jgi:hypothetical protein